MGTKKNLKHVLFTVISLFVMVNPVRAEETEPDKFRFAIGGYALIEYESHISLTNPDLGAGISLSPRDTLGMEYRFWKNVSLGAGLSSNSLDIEEDDPNYRLDFNNSISGGLLYLATYF